MALTLTRKFGPMSLGPMRAVLYEATFDSSYPDNGESLTPANVGLKEFVFVGIDPVDETSGALLFNFDYTNNKVIAYYPTGGATASPTALAAPLLTAGTTAVTGSAATGPITPGIAKEVGDTANLSSVIVRVFALGF